MPDLSRNVSFCILRDRLAARRALNKEMIESQFAALQKGYK